MYKCWEETIQPMTLTYVVYQTWDRIRPSRMGLKRKQQTIQGQALEPYSTGSWSSERELAKEAGKERQKGRREVRRVRCPESKWTKCSRRRE